MQIFVSVPRTYPESDSALLIKTKAIMFTRKRKWILDKRLRLQGFTIPLENTIKYLKVTLDASLNWKTHIDTVSKTELKNLHTAKTYYVKTWGLEPNYAKWIYTQIILPALPHGFMMWNHLIQKSKTLQNQLNSVQRSVLLLMKGLLIKLPQIT